MPDPNGPVPFNSPALIIFFRNRVLVTATLPNSSFSMASDPPAKRRKKSKKNDEISPKKNDNVGSSAVASAPLSPLVVFAHGAGAPSSSDWMIRSFSFLQFSTTSLKL